MARESSTSELPRTLIIMGVSGCGKTLIGSALAQRLGGVFEDADDFHSPANKAKMSSGTPLTDDDRWPWYAALRARIVEMRAATPVYVLACSALKQVYRDRLREGDTAEELRFVLLKGSRDLIQSRLAARKGHYMPASLLDSQLAILEETPDLMAVSVDSAPVAIVDQIVTLLR